MASPYTQRIEEIKAAILPLIIEVVAAAIEEARQEPNKDEKEETADRYLQKRYIVSNGKGGFVTIIQHTPSPMQEYEVIVDGSDFWEHSEGITSPKADAEKIANRILRNIPRYTFTDYIDQENTGNLTPLPPSTKFAFAQTPPPLPQHPSTQPCPACPPPLPTQQPEKRKKKPIGCMVAVGVLAFLYLLGKTASPTAEQQPEHQASTAAPTSETPAKPKLTLDTITRADFERHASALGNAITSHMAAEELLVIRMEAVKDTASASKFARELPDLLARRDKAASATQIALAGIYEKLAAATGEDVQTVAESGRSGTLHKHIDTYCESYDYTSVMAELADRRETCIKRLAARRYYGSSLLESTLSKLTH